MTSSAIRRIAAGVAAALLLVTSASCDDGPTALKTGQLSLRLTDAPGDVSKAVVTIDQIYLQADSTNDNGRIVLRNEDITVDLLTLQDSLMAIMDSVDIPVGTYRQLRFVISGGYVEVIAADTTLRVIYASSPTYAGLPVGAVVTGELQMPSFAQSGLKVLIAGNALQINEDESTTLVVDFDVSQSFGKLAGSSNRWVMSPVINATKLAPQM